MVSANSFNNIFFDTEWWCLLEKISSFSQDVCFIFKHTQKKIGNAKSKKSMRTQNYSFSATFIYITFK